MTESGEQLRLVVWKNLLLRKRRPVILSLEVLWPITIFGLLVALRIVLPAHYQNACYYNARALPSAGGLPLLQGLICNIDNQCLNRTQYEDIPTYPGSRLDSLVGAVSPLFNNEKLLNLAKELPTSARLLDTIVDLLSHDTVKQLLVTGVPVHNLATDVEEARAIFHQVGMPSDVVDSLLSSKLSLPSLVYALITKDAACDEPLIGSIVISSDGRVAHELANLCPFSLDFKESLQQVLNVEEVIRLISGTAEALEQPQMAAQIAELTDLVKLAGRLKFGSGNNWSEIVRHSADVLSHLSHKSNVEFIREIWRDWGHKIFPQIFTDINAIFDTLSTSIQAESSVEHNATELKEFVVALDNVFKAVQSSEGTTNSIFSSLSGTVEDISRHLSLDADWLNIATHWIRAEAAAVSKSHTFPYLPRLVEAAALTLSDSRRLSLLLERHHGAGINVERDICDPDAFGDLISHSGEAREMSAYACSLFKEVIPAVVDKLIGGVKKPYKKANETLAQDTIENVVAFVHALVKASPFDFRTKMDSAISAFIFHTWQEKDESGRAAVVASVLQLIHDFVNQIGVNNLEYVDRVIGAATSIVTILNQHLSELSIRDEMSLSSMFGVVSLQRAVNILTDNVDVILVTIDNILTRGMNTTALSQSIQFCSVERPLSEFLLKDTAGFAELETKFCAAVKQIVPEMSSSGPTKDIQALLGTTTPDKVTDNSASWKELASNIVELKTTLLETAKVDKEMLLRGLEPVEKFMSGLRVLLSMPATETEVFRVKLRALEFLFKAVAPKSAIIPFALRLTRELAELNANPLETADDSVSLLRWAEKNLPTFAGLVIDTAKDPEKIKTLVNSEASEVCQMSADNIFTLPKQRNVQVKTAEAFSELCELLGTSTTAEENTPSEVIVRRLFDEGAAYLNLLTSGQVDSELFKADTWTDALASQMASSRASSVDDLFSKSLTSVISAAGISPNPTALSSYNCSVERALHPQEGSFRSSLWTALKDSNSIISSGLATFMRPSIMKDVVPLVKTWNSKDIFCQDANEGLHHLGSLIGSSPATLINAKNVICVSRNEIAKEFTPCESADPAPKLSDVVENAVRRLSKSDDYSIQPSSFTLSSWTDVIIGLGNLFKNSVFDRNLEDPSSWFSLLDKTFKPHSTAGNEIKALISAAGVWAKQTLSTQTPGSTIAPTEFTHLREFVSSASGGRAFQSAMWFITSAQNDIFDFPFRSLSETFQAHCNRRNTELSRFLCHNETQAFVFHLAKSTATSDAPTMTLEESMKQLLDLLDRVDHTAALNLIDIFDREAARYQNRVLHGLGRVVMSSLWWTPLPTNFLNLVEFSSTLNRVIEVLPSTNVTKFLIDDFASASADFSQLPVSDSRPLIKFLIRNLVPIGAELEKSETILLNLWNSQDLLIKAIYPNETCDENKIVGEILNQLESPEKAMCSIPQGGLQEAYHYFMNVGFSTLTANTTTLGNICLPQLWNQLANWSRLSTAQADVVSKCATDLRYSETAKEAAHATRTASHLGKLASKFSKMQKGSKAAISLDILATQLPVFARFQNIVKNQDLLKQFETVDNRLNDTVINIRWLTHHRSPSRLKRMFCRGSVNPFIQFPDKMYPRTFCNDDFAHKFLDSIDFHQLHSQILASQNESLYSGGWLRPLLRPKAIAAIERIAHKTLPFVQLAEEPLSLETATALLVSLKENELTELHEAFVHLEGPFNEAFGGSETDALVHALRRAMHAIAEMASTGLFDVSFEVAEVVNDPESARKAIMDALGPSSAFVVDYILMLKFDISGFLVNLQTRKLTFVDVVSDITLLKRAFNIPATSTLFDKYSKVLKQAANKLGIPPNPLVTVAQQKLLKNVVDVLLEKSLRKNDLGWDHLVAIFSAFTSAPEVIRDVENSFGLIKDIVGVETIKGLSNLNVSSNGVRVLAHPVALKLIGKLVCGRPLRALEQEFKILQPSTKEPQLNEMDIEELPDGFCRVGYEQVMRLTGGPIIWGFLKPILRGKLLFAPDTEESRLIVSEVNRTLESIGTFRDRLYEWGDASSGLKIMLGRKDAILNVKDALFSSVLEPIMSKILPEGMKADSFDFRKIEEEVGDAGGLVDMLQLVAKISYCFSLDRFQGVATEAELEVLAPQMTRRKEFIAAVVFDFKQRQKRASEQMKRPNLKSIGRAKRGFWEMIGFIDDESEARLPSDIRYKIRMDIDNVPLTHRLKDLFWKPGAKADFFEDMRYQRGFSQMQQVIDSAIVSVLHREHHNGTSTNEALYLPPSFVQQFPYPCYEDDAAGHFLKSILPMATLLSWLFCVAFLIRQRVLDREQHLQEVLGVMGLRPWVDVVAWVLLSGSILLFVVIVTTLMAWYIVPHSSFWLLLIFYSAFAMSILSFCYLVSNILQNNATLAALTGTLLYIISFIPFIVTLTSESILSLGMKLLLCTSMSSAFCYGSLYITRFEQQTLGLTWTTAFSSPLAGDQMNFMYALAMLYVCTIMYAVLGWYCGHIFCNNPILRKKWYFIFQYEFFFGNKSDDDDALSIDEKADGVTISDLVVRFGPDNTAVNGLTLQLRDGEITSLLGQNGAGKTTTIRVLTGQCRATEGFVQAYGIDCRNLRELRRLIGYCPQYNTLFDKLTVREHFQFFAKLKCSGLASEEQIENEVTSMIHMMDLAHLENRLSCELSGGLQRRLCVGLSFIGGSKLIILDEPTSSVDPVARRQIWDLVLKYRKRRTILLTTHHMDEADILSDQVAIIHKGDLLCQGSPITLKTRFGCGYQLAISRNSGRGSDSGLSTSDVSLTSNNFSVDLIDDIREFVPSAVIVSDESDLMVINLPHRSEDGHVYDFAALYQKLDTTSLLSYHGFSNYRVTSTTLEDAFLNLCSDGNPICPSNTQISPEFESGGSDGSASPVWDSTSTNSLYLTSNDRIRGTQLVLTQLRALLQKRAMHSMRNWKVLFSSVVMPCIFIALAMGITTLKPDTIKEPSLDLHMNLYGKPALSVVSGHPDQYLMKEFIGENAKFNDGVNVLPGDGYCPAVDRARNSLDWGSIETLDAFNSSQLLFVLDPSEVELTDYILATYAEFADKRYGGWSLNSDKVKIWYDNTAHHSLPIYQNQMTNAFLRKHYGNYTVRVANHPLHLTQEQLGRETFLSRLADLGVALVILVGLGFIPASAVIYVVRERAQEEKTVQHCSGVAKPTYWISVYIWDLLVLLTGIALCGFVIQIFGIEIYVGRSNFPAVILLLLLFGFASLPLTQIASHLFSEPSIAFMVTYCLNLFFGLLIFLVLLLCQTAIFDVVNVIGLCIPQYAFIQGVLVLFKNHITADIYDIFDQDVYEDPLRLLAANYWAMLIVGTISSVINILIDCNFLSTPLFRRRTEIVLPQDEDADVVMERKRVISAIGEDILSLINLSKDYKSFGLSKPHRAVDNVSFGIGKGVCFGLLGLNGAGKTTLFKILTGHIQPTSGRAFLKEKTGTYRTLAELNNHVGYCPQSDAVDDLLTPKQQLTIYAQLKGIPSADVDEVVLKALTVFRLQAFADRPCAALSRGTRRKVCTAMAFLGDPQLVLLDEPTTGMDPVTRRLLWNSVQKCVDSGRSVLLTSHSMEECDALCHRLGIMAHGRLRCIGCPDALKYRFSQGYTLALRIEPCSEQQVLQYITKRFPSARVKSLHATSLQISVSSKEASLSTLFSLLQDPRGQQAGLVDFAVQQTTLDQVFVEFASQQRSDDDDEEAFSRVATVSSFGSASYQQLSSKESGNGDDNVQNDDPYIDSTHF